MNIIEKLAHIVDHRYTPSRFTIWYRLLPAPAFMLISPAPCPVVHSYSIRTRESGRGSGIQDVEMNWSPLVVVTKAPSAVLLTVEGQLGAKYPVSLSC
jgi:hypothetical protein